MIRDIIFCALVAVFIFLVVEEHVLRGEVSKPMAVAFSVVVAMCLLGVLRLLSFIVGP